MDLNDEGHTHFSTAESKFLSSLSKRPGHPGYRVDSIDLVINPDILTDFQHKQAEFAKSGKPAKCVLAFHGTREENIDSIIQSNFSLDRIKRSMYGHGIYFSEFADVSMAYAAEASHTCRSLLLCKILPGKEYDLNQSSSGAPLEHGYDSHRVRKDSKGFGEMLVIFNPSQIMPYYIIHYSKVEEQYP